MMTIKKSVIAAATLAAIGAGSMGISSVFAKENTNAPPQRFENLIQALADKFGVSTSDVQAVFDEQRQTEQEARSAEAADRLAQAVSSGELTQAQADALTAHQEEMRTFRDTLKDMTREERDAAIKAQRESNKTWASDNDIPASFFGQQRGNHRGPGRHERNPGMGMMK